MYSGPTHDMTRSRVYPKLEAPCSRTHIRTHGALISIWPIRVYYSVIFVPKVQRMCTSNIRCTEKIDVPLHVISAFVTETHSDRLCKKIRMTAESRYGLMQ